MINVRIGDKSDTTLESVQKRILKLDYLLKRLEGRLAKKQDVLKQQLTKITPKDKALFEKGLKRLEEKFKEK